MNESENNISSDYNIDKVYDDIQQPEAPMSAEAEGIQEILAPKEAPFFQMELGEDKKVQAFSREQVQEAMSYQHANKGRLEGHDGEVEKFNLDKTKFENDRTEFDKTFTDYKKIDDYARANPAWWDHVQSTFQKNNEYKPGEKDNISSHPMVQNLNAKIDSLMSVVNQQNDKAKQLEIQSQDQGLNKTIEDYKAKYSNFDWNAKDQMGYSLEDRITNHAIQKKTSNFGIAANDYLFEEHIKLAKSKALEEQATQIQNNNKLGLGPISDQSMLKKTVGNQVDVKKMSYNDIANMITSQLT